MLTLLGGVALLAGLLLLIYLFVNADPAKLARGLKWTAIGGAVVLFLFLLLSERFQFIWLPLAMVFPYLRRVRSLLSGTGFRRASAGGATSDVSTPYLRMSLDHDTGAMTGTVLAGSFTGMRLEELDRDELLALLRQCRAADEEGARLLEAYLDRIHPNWRDEFTTGHDAPPRGNSDDISVAEAYEILGLAPGASEAEIRAAHHRLMMQLHPDHGGTDYLATKINRARDLLLGR